MSAFTTYGIVKMARSIILVSLVVLALRYTSAPPIHVVHSHWGTIQGVAQTSPTGKPYVTYLGIPYAKPPVGDLRFKDPVPHPSPQGVFKTSTNFSVMCPQPPQPRLVLPEQDEDCLTLNVFTPRRRSRTPRAVMFWIHGGGWTVGGANNYNMWKIVTEGDVIGVSIQYRLGVLGFLSTGSQEARGNYAMLDQVLALKWVNDNIDAFGGDVNNITIYGESAGGASVSLHTISPLSKGLFKRAIMQSGTAPGYWTSRRDTSRFVYHIAKNVNCPVPPSGRPDDQADAKMLECLRKLPYETLIEKSQLDVSMTEYSFSIIWRVVPDNHFLKDDPAKLYKNSKFLESVGFYDYDLMFGVNNAEGSYSLGQANQYGIDHNISAIDVLSDHNYYYNTFLPAMLKFVFGQAPRVDIDVLSYQSLDYEAYKPPYPLFNHTAVSVMETVTNIAFVVPTILAARAHAADSSSGKTYLYYFDHYPLFRRHTYIYGMPHGGDIDYSFGIDEADIRRRLNFSEPISQGEYRLSYTFVQILADFAKTGDPNAALNTYLYTHWPEFSEPDESYLSFGRSLAVKQHLRKKGVDVWLDLIPKLHEDLKNDCSIKPGLKGLMGP